MEPTFKITEKNSKKNDTDLKSHKFLKLDTTDTDNDGLVTISFDKPY